MKEHYEDSELIADAAQIVNLLTEQDPPAEITRVCSECAREHKIVKPNMSHGLCKRHFLKWAKINELTPEQTEEMLVKAEAEDGFAPDLGPVHKPHQGSQAHAAHLKSKYPTLHGFLRQHHRPVRHPVHPPSQSLLHPK